MHAERRESEENPKDLCQDNQKNKKKPQEHTQD